MRIQKSQRAQLQIVEIKRRKTLLFFVKPALDIAQHLGETDGVVFRQEIEAQSRNSTADSIARLQAPEQFVKTLDAGHGPLLWPQLAKVLNRLAVSCDRSVVGRLGENCP